MPDKSERGRDARHPASVPFRGWIDTLKRTQAAMGRNHVSLMAAGGAFYALLAIFPAVAAVVAVWGLVADPAEVVRQMQSVTAALPPDAASILTDQAAAAAENDAGALITATVSILIGIWSASKGTNALIEGLNVVYGETDDRGFFGKVRIRLALTAVAVVGVVLAVGLVAILPAVLKAVGLARGVETSIGVAKWLLLALGALGFFSVLYRFAPSRRSARWTWVTPGALAAVVLWIAGSAGFSVYVSSFANYNETYGTLGGVVILLMWLFLSCFAILMGAALNVEAERQTREDTTVGRDLPMGDRDAYAADTLGDAPA